MRKHNLATIEKIRRSCLKRDFSKQHKRIEATVKATSKKVKCIETGETFNSETATAKEYGVSVMSVSRVCRGLRHTLKGLHFTFV